MTGSSFWNWMPGCTVWTIRVTVVATVDNLYPRPSTTNTRDYIIVILPTISFRATLTNHQLMNLRILYFLRPVMRPRTQRRMYRRKKSCIHWEMILQVTLWPLRFM